METGVRRFRDQGFGVQLRTTVIGVELRDARRRHDPGVGVSAVVAYQIDGAEAAHFPIPLIVKGL